MRELPIGRARPNDERGFIHKKILGGVAKFAGIASAVGIPGAGAVSTFARTFGGGGRPTLPRAATARTTQFSRAEKQRGQAAKFAPDLAPVAARPLASAARTIAVPGTGPCADPRLTRAPDGHCVAPGSGHFLQHFPAVGNGAAAGGGTPVLGIYGAGVTPGSRMIDRAVCGKKMQLGDDGICYNRSQISNKQRMWPAGRKPLLTGGDMRAIAIASRAGRRMDGATTRLRKLGMMKKAPTARAPKAPTQHQRLLEAHATK